jgi:hypothetical protein
MICSPTFFSSFLLVFVRWKIGGKFSLTLSWMEKENFCEILKKGKFSKKKKSSSFS